LELSVVVDNLKKARACRDARQQDIDRLMGELGKKSFLAQTNLKRIVQKFRE
jgi:hypothetical protein